MHEFTRTVSLAAGPARVWETITDFAKYSAIVPQFREVAEESSGQDRARVRFLLSLPVKNVAYRLDYQMIPGRKLSWRMVDSDTLEDNSGEWLVEQDGKGTKVTYTHRVKFPAWIAWAVSQPAFEKEMGKTLDKFIAHIDGPKPESDAQRIIRMMDERDS